MDFCPEEAAALQFFNRKHNDMMMNEGKDCIGDLPIFYSTCEQVRDAMMQGNPMMEQRGVSKQKLL